MNKFNAFTCLLSTTLTLLVSGNTFADTTVDCGDAVTAIRSSVGMSDSVGAEALTLDRLPMKAFESADHKTTLEASAGSADTSWVIVTFRDTPTKWHDLQLSYSQCKVQIVVANQKEMTPGGVHLVDQVSAGTQFCKNLNAGIQPQPLAVSYLEFKDGSGNIAASKLDAAKALCKVAAPYLN